MSALLPEGFEELSEFVEIWAVPDASARDMLRGSVPAGDRQKFYNAFAPRLEETLDFLDKTPLATHDPKQTNLMSLALSFAHAAQAQEVQGPDEAKHAQSRMRLPIICAPADR
ncbi:hypothetical protein [Sphingorhabdus sp. M41]|uniref:hypothetical protein n=1 Tax=Sphingorhabdus sp. M41 TaxID=1806885 RepID=UPI00078EEF19|nr:hypothetical protein [Sphingorhabdus sp. M41]AMO70597.1 hypothetical protein AZE99_00880 [Sphingorhabdus sp. M41]|tara:strand:+ start:40236 stop:40574 length:339 start_codon:yes stop_codon:yes gene_type:complete